MNCPKCNSGMARVEEPFLERYECWTCGKIVYDPLPEDVVTFEAPDSLPVCCNCSVEFQPTERNQVYCEDCRELRSKPSGTFEHIQDLLTLTTSELVGTLSSEELDLLIAQVKGYQAVEQEELLGGE